MAEAETISDLKLSDEDHALVAVLRDLIARRGASLLANRRMLIGLLRDYAPDRARAIKLLMTAYDNEAPARLQSRARLEAETLDSEARSLSGDTGLRDDLARWAVGIWAAALTAPATAPPAVAVAPPKSAADDLTWSTPAQPPPAPPASAPPAASAESLTWSTPTAPVPPAPPAAHPQAPAEDLTWSTPVAPPPAAPASAPTASPPVAAAADRKRSLGGRFALGGSLAVVAIVSLISGLNRLGLFSDEPTAEPPPQPAAEPAPKAQAPVVRTHGGGVATIVGTMSDGQPVVLGSNSQNFGDWPIIPDAVHPNNDPRAWRFTTGVKFPDNVVFLYQPTILMGANLDAGAATTVSVNLSTASGKNPVSVSKTANAVRTRDPSGVYRLDVMFSDWQTNVANAPKICLVLTLEASPARFEPQVFCATAFVNGACSPQYLGCGYFH